MFSLKMRPRWDLHQRFLGGTNFISKTVYIFYIIDLLCSFFFSIRIDMKVYSPVSVRNAGPNETKENNTTFLLEMVDQFWKKIQSPKKTIFCCSVPSLWGITTYRPHHFETLLLFSVFFFKNSRFLKVFEYKINLFL